MVVRKRSKSGLHARLVSSHITLLHSLAQDNLYIQPLRAKRYVSLIRRLSRKFQFRLPRPVKHSFCKHCYVPFAPGKNCRVRLRNGFITYSCFSCKKQTRIPYNSKK